LGISVFLGVSTGERSLSKSNKDLRLRGIDDLNSIRRSLRVALGKKIGRNGAIHPRQELVDEIVRLRRSVREGVEAGRIPKERIRLTIAFAADKRTKNSVSTLVELKRKKVGAEWNLRDLTDDGV
jgi:hypothetical protein